MVYEHIQQVVVGSKHSSACLSGWTFPLSAASSLPTPGFTGTSMPPPPSNLARDRMGHVRNRSSSAPPLSVEVPPTSLYPLHTIGSTALISPNSAWSTSTPAPTPLPGTILSGLDAACQTPFSAAVHSPTHGHQSGFQSFAALGLVPMSDDSGEGAA